jgi:dihydrofolate synthase / folylpolyglutamate synthase
MNYEQAVHYLYSLGNEVLTAKLGLKNISTLLGYLGHPQNKFPSILIAGTNGKGSVAAFCHSILKQSGYHTGLYTSPHLIQIEERIQVDGNCIAPEEFARLTGVVKEAIHSLMKPAGGAGNNCLERHPTYFEVVTAMAFLYFAGQNVEIAVLEVGLGGRFDATNVVGPEVALITNVDYDHQKFLGCRLEEIAWEKAGVIKRHTVPPGPPGTRELPGTEPLPVVTAARNDLVLGILEEQCRQVDARLINCWQRFRPQTVEDARGRAKIKIDLLGINNWEAQLPLPGTHQVDNALTAIAAMELLACKGWHVTADSIREGLENARWPGRLEILDLHPVLVLDGAHNAAGAFQLASYIKQFLDPDRTLLIFGVMQDKDYRAMGELLFPLARQVLLTRTQWVRAADPLQIISAFPEWQAKCQIASTTAEALEMAWSQAAPEETVVVAGSLFLVGEARRILKERFPGGAFPEG